MSNIEKLFIMGNSKLQSRVLVVALFFALLFSSLSYATAQSSQIQGARDSKQVYSGVVYGPIDQSDTLWQIASRYKQDELFTVYQTMMAIYELNPQAFENGNFNTMVNGATLQLPSDRFIARMDPARSRSKADSDARAVGWASATERNKPVSAAPSGGNNSSVPVPNNNMKPEVALVNQDDLSKTSTELQSQLTGLRRQQQQQFLQLKNQVAESINSVEVLLQENKKLNIQLVQLDANNRKLTEKVEVELQTQIDQQVDQLNQLITLVKDAEQRRVDKESESILNILSSPLALIIIMFVVTLLIIVSLAIFLLRKPTVAAPVPVPEVKAAPKDIVDDDLVIGEVGDDLDQDSEDLMAALSSEDTSEEDDILSDALEEDDLVSTLSDAEMQSELDSLDDMLVPDSPTDISDKEIEKERASENLADEWGMEDDTISLDNDDSFPLEDDGEIQKITESASDNDFLELAEIPDTSDTAPQGIDLDENGEIDANTIDQIETQIEDKNETLTRMADEILDELDNGPADTSAGMPIIDTDDDSDLSDEILLDLEDEGESARELDALLNSVEDLDDDKLNLDLDDDDFENDQVSAMADELLQELESESNEVDELDKLLDEIDGKDQNENQGQDDESDHSWPDADDLLDDIPSFTNELTLEDVDENEDVITNVDKGFNKDSGDNTLEENAELDENVLSGLQGLDNWLDDNEPLESTNQEDLDLTALTLDSDDVNSLGDNASLDDELVEGLDDIDFDDMLNDMSLYGDDENELNDELVTNDPLSAAGLDLDALTLDASLEETMQESGSNRPQINKQQATFTNSSEDDINNFVDVDDLLDESDAIARISDDDIQLNLEGSLDLFLPQQQDDATSIGDVESDQASNLDLAQVYMDMEDYEAAKELLDDVVRLGNQEQQEEANALLGKIV
jgi:pilus assembly protein FimV